MILHFTRFANIREIADFEIDEAFCEKITNTEFKNCVYTDTNEPVIITLSLLKALYQHSIDYNDNVIEKLENDIIYTEGDESFVCKLKDALSDYMSELENDLSFTIDDYDYHSTYVDIEG